MIMFDITAFGELLIDYTPAGKSPAGMDLFEQNPGGAPANVLACAAKLGQKTAFIGKIGLDMQGRFLRKTLQEAGIDTTSLISDENFFTTLAFVSLSESGERSFSFARKPGADTRIRSDEIDPGVIRNSRIFHFGSLSLTDSPARETTHFLLEEAKSAGCLISYDPNFRPLLWTSREHAVREMRSVLPYVDLIKLSDEETELLTGFESPQEAAEKLIESGVQVAAVTLGRQGVLLAAKDGCVTIPGFAAEVLDTTGAGDAFWGAFLYCIGELLKTITLQTDQNAPNSNDTASLLRTAASFPLLAQCARFANAAAALCVTKRGAIPAMPELHEITALINC